MTFFGAVVMVFAVFAATSALPIDEFSTSQDIDGVITTGEQQQNEFAVPEPETAQQSGLEAESIQKRYAGHCGCDCGMHHGGWGGGGGMHGYGHMGGFHGGSDYGWGRKVRQSDGVVGPISKRKSCCSCCCCCCCCTVKVCCKCCSCCCCKGKRSLNAKVQKRACGGAGGGGGGGGGFHHGGCCGGCCCSSSTSTFHSSSSHHFGGGFFGGGGGGGGGGQGYGGGWKRQKRWGFDFLGGGGLCKQRRVQ